VRTADGQGIDATTFIVKKDAERTGLWTSKEYVGHIVTGLLRNGAPPDYVEHVITVAIENNERASERADEEARRITTLRAS
jgi:hypothetical protein